MPAVQITNPNGAFGAPVIGASPLLQGGIYAEFVASAAITAGMSVQLGATGQAAPAAAAGEGVVGVALDTVATGQVVRVVILGPVLGLCIAQTGGVVAGTLYSAAATGSFGAASATIGDNIVVALNSVAAGQPFNAYVCKV